MKRKTAIKQTQILLTEFHFVIFIPCGREESVALLVLISILKSNNKYAKSSVDVPWSLGTPVVQ